MWEQHLAHSCCSISGCLPIPQIQLLRLFCSVILPSSSLTGLLWLYVVAKKQKQLQCFSMKNIWKLYVPVPRLGSFDLLPKHDQRAFFSWNTVFRLPGPKHFVLTPWTLNLERFEREPEILWGGRDLTQGHFGELLQSREQNPDFLLLVLYNLHPTAVETVGVVHLQLTTSREPSLSWDMGGCDQMDGMT